MVEAHEDWDGIEVRSDSAAGEQQLEHLGDVWPEEAPGRSRAGWFVGAVLLLVISVCAWWWLRHGDVPPEDLGVPDGQSAGVPEAVVPESQVEPLAAVEVDPPPALDDSDSWLRGLLVGASEHPRFDDLLQGGELVRTVVKLTAAVAYGDELKIPAALRPHGAGFLAEPDGGTFRPSAANAERYQVAVSLLASIDTGMVAQIYSRAQPLFEQAHRDLGLPGSMAETGRRALRQLERVADIPEPRLVRRHTSWHFADPALESLSPSQKAFLRLAPEQRLQVIGFLRRLVESTLG